MNFCSELFNFARKYGIIFAVVYYTAFLEESIVKKIKVYILSLLSVLLVFTSATPAYAEGFTYDFPYYSKSIYMLNLDSSTAVYSMNAHEKLPIASLTKIMAYIVAYENIPNVETTLLMVDPSIEPILKAAGSATPIISTGEELTVLELLNLMMVPTGNEASLVLAQYIDARAGQSYSEDSIDYETFATDMGNSEFVRLMNEKAVELGCENTNFTNPHGLHNENHYSTARDMAIIAEYATTLPYFSEISSQTFYTLRPTNLNTDERTFYSTNLMMSSYASEGKYYYTYATGIKTGSHKEAGFCIAASASYDGYTYIVVALGSPMYDSDDKYIDSHGEMLDTATLFRWAFLNLENKVLVQEYYLVGDVALEHAWDVDRLQVVTDRSIQALLPSDASVSQVTINADLPDTVQAPVEKGDVIGTVEYVYDGVVIATSNAIAATSVNRSEIVRTVDTGIDILTSPWFLLVVGIIILLIAVYFLIAVLQRKSKKKMRSVRKYRNM